MRGDSVRRSGLGLATVVAITMAMMPAAALATEAGSPGRLDEREYRSENGVNPYLVYTPSTAASDDRALVVVVHGCGTTAEQQRQANRQDAVAERHGFVVLLPDTNENNPGRCWRAVFGDPRSLQRDSGDAAVIAGMTREVIREYRIDPQRVYIVGMSSGAFQTSVMAAAYPDLYAAAGIHAGGGYATTVGCVATSNLPATTILAAQAAFLQMAERARVVPIWSLSGDADGLYGCTRQALEIGLRTNNLVLSGDQSKPLALTPARTRSGEVPGGRDFTVDTYLDRDGCVIGEFWAVHGMDHYWSGGSPDPQWALWTDPTGPDAAEASWQFFKRYRKDHTGGLCATAAR